MKKLWYKKDDEFNLDDIQVRVVDSDYKELPILVRIHLFLGRSKAVLFEDRDGNRYIEYVSIYYPCYNNVNSYIEVSRCSLRRI